MHKFAWFLTWLQMSDLTPLDWAALAWFFIAWFGFTFYANHSRYGAQCVSAPLSRLRVHWMREMLGRDLRVVDAQVQLGLQNGIAFFASTSILVSGGLIAVLGAREQTRAVLADLPFSQQTSTIFFELKILLLILIFVYAFFKFARAYRLTTYLIVLIGAAPVGPGLGESGRAYAENTARLGDLLSDHMTGGLRAFFFALAALGWFLHPLVFLVTTTWVLYVMYRREFRSRARDALVAAEASLTRDTSGKSPTED